MTASDNVLLAGDPVARELLLSLLDGCRDLKEAAARLTETVLNALMSAQVGEGLAKHLADRGREAAPEEFAAYLAAQAQADGTVADDALEGIAGGVNVNRAPTSLQIMPGIPCMIGGF